MDVQRHSALMWNILVIVGILTNVYSVQAGKCLHRNDYCLLQCYFNCFSLSMLLYTIVWLFSETRDYCQTDTFTPQCPRGEVVTVTSATFGRMKIGKCATVNFGRY